MSGLKIVRWIYKKKLLNIELKIAELREKSRMRTKFLSENEFYEYQYRELESINSKLKVLEIKRDILNRKLSYESK